MLLFHLFFGNFSNDQDYIVLVFYTQQAVNNCPGYFLLDLRKFFPGDPITAKQICGFPGSLFYGQYLGWLFFFFQSPVSRLNVRIEKMPIGASTPMPGELSKITIKYIKDDAVFFILN